MTICGNIIYGIISGVIVTMLFRIYDKRHKNNRHRSGRGY